MTGNRIAKKHPFGCFFVAVQRKPRDSRAVGKRLTDEKREGLKVSLPQRGKVPSGRGSPNNALHCLGVRGVCEADEVSYKKCKYLKRDKPLK